MNIRIHTQGAQLLKSTKAYYKAAKRLANAEARLVKFGAACSEAVIEETGKHSKTVTIVRPNMGNPDFDAALDDYYAAVADLKEHKTDFWLTHTSMRIVPDSEMQDK